MTDLLQRTADALSCVKGKKLVIGVSGGRDSVCLLHAVISCGEVKKEDVLALHVHHGLRDTADRDERFVRELCDKWGVAFKSVHVDVKRAATEKGMTVEQAARELRYGAFYDAVKSGAADVILTAHHALDNAESVLMHLFRGSGLDGLRGMSGGVLRPFLDVYPAELDEYVERNGLSFVVDETNLDDGADRNFIRLRILPLVEERYPGAVRAINALSEECADACDYLDGATDDAYIAFDRGAVVVADAALDGPLAARYVRRALAHFTLTDMTRQQIQKAVSLAHMRTGAVIELSHGVRAAREYGGVAFYIPHGECGAELELKQGANHIDGLTVDVDTVRVDPASVRGGVADMQKLAGATLRFRRDGDMFTPYGGGQKKLKQYLTDKKVPARLKDRIPLVCRGSEVLVVVGMEISDKVKVTGGTTTYAVIRQR